MFDIGWAELVIIGVVALIVIGPKDLPEMFRTLGRFTAKLRSMSRDFQRAMETAAKESGVKDVAADLKGMTSPSSLGLNAVREAASKFEKWDPLKPKPATPKPAAPTTTPAAETSAAPVTALGPATQALADQVAARKAIAQEAAEKLRAVSAAAVVTEAAPPAKKAPGRVRSAVAKPDEPSKAKPTSDAPAKAKAPAKPKAAKTKGE